MEIDNQVLALESQISERFTKDNDVTVHFKYVPDENDEDKIILKLYTYNINTGMNFLFNQLKASSHITVLSKMLLYISTDMKEENEYLVNWNTKSDAKLNESYFRSSDIECVMVKFYDGKKNRDEIEVTNVQLNTTVIA